MLLRVSAMEELYEYKSLTENEIRLVEILPGSESHVSLRIHNVSLDDHPPYVALSYTWGTEPTDHTILIDHKILKIKPNLDAALHELRARPVWFVPENERDRFMAITKRILALIEHVPSPELNESVARIMERLEDGVKIAQSISALLKPEGGVKQEESRRAFSTLATVSDDLERLWGECAAKDGVPMLYNNSKLLWIDAICINQEDINERRAQVSIMRKIYKEATSLTVWLGPEDDDSHKAFLILREFEKEGVLSDTTFDSDRAIQTVTGANEGWLAIAMLFSRPWFKRVWILQEYTLGGYQTLGKPEAIVFCCGKDRIQNLVALGCHTLLHKYTLQSTVRHRSAGYWRMIMIQVYSIHNILQDYKRRYGGQPHHPNRYQLVPLVIRSRIADSTDPRDRIYSLLGLAEELYGGQPLDFQIDDLIIDYEATVEDVYSSFVRAVVNATKRLDILGACYPEQLSCVRRTWTPDWTTGTAHGILVTEITNSDSAELYEFTYDATKGTECIAEFAPDLTTLSVTGFAWDEIVFVSCRFTNSGDDDVATDEFKEDCSKILSLSKEIMYRNKQDCPDLDLDGILLKTLVTTRRADREGSLSTDIWKYFFLTWMKRESPTYYMEVEDLHQTIEDFLLAMKKTMTDSRIVLTKDGHIGRSRHSVKSGDTVCLLLGCALPMVLRPTSQSYTLVAEAYFTEIMHGEAMSLLTEGKKVLQEFELR